MGLPFLYLFKESLRTWRRRLLMDPPLLVEMVRCDVGKTPWHRLLRTLPPWFRHLTSEQVRALLPPKRR